MIEAVVTIVIMSIASATIFIPFLVSSQGIGGKGAAGKVRLALVAHQQAELYTRSLTGLSQTQWSQTLQSLAASSPLVISPDKTLDGETYRAIRSATCVAQDLAANDAACSAGFAKLTVTVTAINGGDTVTVNLIKTRAGI